MHNRKNFLAAMIAGVAGLAGIVGGMGGFAENMLHAGPSLLDQIPSPDRSTRGGKGHGWSRPTQVAKVRAAKRRRIAARANPRGIR